MQFQEKKLEKTWNSVKTVEVAQAILNTAQKLEKSIFRDFGDLKNLKKSKNSIPTPILTAGRAQICFSRQ